MFVIVLVVGGVRGGVEFYWEMIFCSLGVGEYCL